MHTIIFNLSMEGKKNITFSSSQVYWGIFIMFILLLGGFFYYQLKSWEHMGKELYPNTSMVYADPHQDQKFASYQSLTESPEGNYFEDGKYHYRITNDKGYSIVPKEHAAISIQEYKEPNDAYGGIAGCASVITVEKGDLSNIELSSKSACGKDEECTSYSFREKTYNDIVWYEIRYFGEYIGSGWPMYVTERKGNIYTIYMQCNSQEFIDSVLGQFTFI